MKQIVCSFSISLCLREREIDQKKGESDREMVLSDEQKYDMLRCAVLCYVLFY